MGGSQSCIGLLSHAKKSLKNMDSSKPKKQGDCLQSCHVKSLQEWSHVV
jgi:hypothetical protein